MILRATGLVNSGLMMLWNQRPTFHLSQLMRFCRQIKLLIYAATMKRRLSLKELNGIPLIISILRRLVPIKADLFFVVSLAFGHG